MQAVRIYSQTILGAVGDKALLHTAASTSRRRTKVCRVCLPVGAGCTHKSCTCMPPVVCQLSTFSGMCFVLNDNHVRSLAVVCTQWVGKVGSMDVNVAP